MRLSAVHRAWTVAQAGKVERPYVRALPERTRPSRVISVSSSGVSGSG